MCGITGFYETSGNRSRSELHVMGKSMAGTMSHRGPDSHDLWQDPDLPLVLAHRRLSIIDLSSDGAQPMESHSGRYILIFNGEIYNYRIIQKELANKNIAWRGRSDTEVFLAAVEHWGLNRTLQKINGMFAFTLWDLKDRALHFARDRLGKKPLYIGWCGKTLVFGSELKALRAHPDFTPALDTEALHGFLRLGYIEAPHSIYKDVWQLPPGQRLSIDLQTVKPGETLTTQMKPYWDALQIAGDARAHITEKSDADIIEEFETLLSTCVSERMISDVPLGAFLSGGIDSSSVVALMQKTSSQPVKTYSIGFEEDGFDEARYARKIAAHLETDHHEHICTGADALDVIPKLPDMYDEPFADISAIPTYLVSAFARKDVTVALSGDGGDEMLGGYVRHTLGPKLWSATRTLPRFLRKGLATGLQYIPTGILDTAQRGTPQFGSKVQKAASIMALNNQEDIYERLICKWPRAPVLGADLYNPQRPLPRGDSISFAEKMMLWDAHGYLPHDILTKVDRASMAVSLEARAPLLDARIYEYVWSLPENVKIRGGKGKWLLQQVLKKHVPEELFERPKQGFAIPVGDWLRGPLRDWAEDLLDENTLNDQGLLDTREIRKTWQAHLKGRGNHGEALWVILMFQLWHQRWM